MMNEWTHVPYGRRYSHSAEVQVRLQFLTCVFSTLGSPDHFSKDCFTPVVWFVRSTSKKQVGHCSMLVLFQFSVLHWLFTNKRRGTGNLLIGKFCRLSSCSMNMFNWHWPQQMIFFFLWEGNHGSYCSRSTIGIIAIWFFFNHIVQTWFKKKLLWILE